MNRTSPEYFFSVDDVWDKVAFKERHIHRRPHIAVNCLFQHVLLATEHKRL